MTLEAEPGCGRVGISLFTVAKPPISRRNLFGRLSDYSTYRPRVRVFRQKGRTTNGFAHWADKTPWEPTYHTTPDWRRKNQRLHSTGGLIYFDLADVSVDYEDPQIVAVLTEWEHKEP